MFEGAVARVAHHEKPIRPESEFRRLVLERLERLGVIERHEGRLIVDVDRFRGPLIKQIRGTADLRPGGDCDTYFERGAPELFYELFHDKRVISKEDWEREGEKAKPKKLFYTPETADIAFDPQKIRTQEFYLGLWEIAIPMQMKSRRDMLYPSRHEHLRMSEVAIAALVYHPKFGDGSRDERGRLLVRDPKSGEPKPIQGHWFAQMGFTGGANDEYGGSLQTPREYLTRHAPQIIQRGLVRAEDFKATTVPGSYDRPVERFKLSPKGIVMIHGVLHTLGRKYVDYQVKELSPGVGALMEAMPDGSQHIRHTFNILHPGDPRLKTVKFGQGATREAAGVEVTDVRPYHGMEVSGLEQLNAAQGFWRELKVNFAGLSSGEQQRLAKAIEGLDEVARQRLKAFAKEFGMQGVRTSLSVEADARQGRQIFALVDQLGKPVAHSVFRKYNEILNLSQRTTEDISNHLFSQTSNRVLDRAKLDQEFSRRASRVLTEFIAKAQDAKKRKKAIYAEDLTQDLQRYEQDLVLFAGVCKTLKGDLALEDMRGAGLSRRRITELTEDERAQMEEIFERNWRKLKAGVYEEMRQELFTDRSEQGLFFLFKKEDKILGYVKFEPLKDEKRSTVRGDFFNMDSVLQDSGIGEAMLKRILDGLAKEHVIRAEFYPESDVGAMYIERFGFVATNAEDGVGKGEKVGRWIGIMRDDQVNKKLTRSDVGLKSLGDGTRVEQAEALFEIVKKAETRGKVVSRYVVKGKGEDARRYVGVEALPHR